jgi:hypothetical protein
MIVIPDTALYKQIKDVFSIRDDHTFSIDTLSYHPRLDGAYIWGHKVKNLYGVQFITCSNATLSCNNTSIEELTHFPPHAIFIRIQNSNLKRISALPKNLKILYVPHNNIENIAYLPEGLEECDLSNNKLKILPPLPKSLKRLNYANNPIDTSLLPAELKANPCLYDNQNCIPLSTHFEGLFNIKFPSPAFDVNTINKFEMCYRCTEAKSRYYTEDIYQFHVSGNTCFLDTITNISSNRVYKSKQHTLTNKINFKHIRILLDHMLAGDKVLPLSHIDPSDRSGQIIDLYNQLDGRSNAINFTLDGITCDCSFTIFTPEKTVSFEIYLGNVFDHKYEYDSTDQVFPTKELAYEMYSYALFNQLLPHQAVTKTFFTQRNFYAYFKKRIGLK